MVLPQGIAYASIAGLSNYYGLYSSFMGVIVYCFMGSSRDITLGPTALMSLIVAASFEELNHAPVGDTFPPPAASSEICGCVQRANHACAAPCDHGGVLQTRSHDKARHSKETQGTPKKKMAQWNT
jgi:hypothetical protein